jgi:hypothetical protein
MTNTILSSTWNPDNIPCSVDGCPNVAHHPLVLSEEMAAIKKMPRNLSKCIRHTPKQKPIKVAGDWI